MKEIQFYWHNYRTGQAELRDTPTEDEVADFLPSHPIGYNLYQLHRKMGKPHLDAMLAVYEKATSRQEDANVTEK